ncbi:hypothetical protein ABS767_17565, partial [Sphingomonas sp. ST-64]
KGAYYNYVRPVIVRGMDLTIDGHARGNPWVSGPMRGAGQWALDSIEGIAGTGAGLMRFGSAAVFDQQKAMAMAGTGVRNMVGALDGVLRD